MNTELNQNNNLNSSIDSKAAQAKAKKEKLFKSKLNLMKNVKGLSSIFNNSSTYWKNTLNSIACCDRNNLGEEDQPVNQEGTLFKISNETEEIKKIKMPKEWTNEELETLKYQYYSLGNKNPRKLAEIITTKTPVQISYRIKKLEEKSNTRSFTRQDDINLIELANKYNKDWNIIAQFFVGCSPKSLEERYTNKLDPKLKRVKFNAEEDEKIIRLYNQFGNNWKEIASYFPDRNSNMIKNRFYSFLKKKNNIKTVSIGSNSNGPGMDSSSAVNDFSNEQTFTENMNNNMENNYYINGMVMNNTSPKGQNKPNISSEYFMNKLHSYNSADSNNNNNNVFNTESNINYDTNNLFNIGLPKSLSNDKINFNPACSTAYYNKPSNSSFGQAGAGILGTSIHNDTNSNQNSCGDGGNKEYDGFFFGSNRTFSGNSDDLLGMELGKNCFVFGDNNSNDGGNNYNNNNYNYTNPSVPFYTNSFQNNLTSATGPSNQNMNNINYSSNSNPLITNDYFMQECQKIFSLQPNNNKNMDFDDSGSGNNLFAKGANPENEMKIEENLEDNKNSSILNTVMGSSQPSSTTMSEENKRRMQDLKEEEIFNESKNLEDILQKLDAFISKNKAFDENNIQNIKDPQILDMVEKNKKAESMQVDMTKKLNELKAKFYTNKDNRSKMDKESLDILLDINSTLIQLIHIGKLKIAINNQILFQKTKSKELEMELE